MVSGDELVINGEKQSDEEEKKELEVPHYYNIEGSDGPFGCIMIIPFEIDPDTVNADLEDGVLTAMLRKPPEIIEKQRILK